MNKTIQIEGMSCNHCKMHVEKALNGVAGVQKAIVDLNAKNASVTLDSTVTDDELKRAVEDAGYEVTGIQ